MGKHRLPSKIVGILEDALESAQMKRAGFDGVSDTKGTIITVRRASGYEQVYKKSVTDFIKEETRLYRGSWIVHPIEEVLAWSKSKDDGSMLEYELLRRVEEGSWPHPDNLDDIVREVEMLRSRNHELEAFKRKVEEGLQSIAENAHG